MVKAILMLIGIIVCVVIALVSGFCIYEEDERPERKLKIWQITLLHILVIASISVTGVLAIRLLEMF